MTDYTKKYNDVDIFVGDSKEVLNEIIGNQKTDLIKVSNTLNNTIIPYIQNN
jgi:hypothetical protein